MTGITTYDRSQVEQAHEPQHGVSLAMATRAVLTPGTCLAVHGMFEHGDYAYINDWQPKSIKIVNPDAGRCERAYQMWPHATVVLRDHSLSEQHDYMFADPVAAGISHADSYAAHIGQWCPQIPREQLVCTGINEPRVWNANGPAVTTAYYVAFLDRLAYHGLHGGALNLSVGWPANTGKDTPPSWGPFAAVQMAISRGGHTLILHEYWDHNGPANMWRWWAGRYTQCPWAVPIIIGECGLDEYVSNAGVGTDSRGWLAHVTQDVYMQQLIWYDGQLRSDGRIHSLPSTSRRPGALLTYDPCGSRS
jgi:hypothetical protein